MCARACVVFSHASTVDHARTDGGNRPCWCELALTAGKGETPALTGGRDCLTLYVRAADVYVDDRQVDTRKVVCAVCLVNVNAGLISGESRMLACCVLCLSDVLAVYGRAAG